MQSSKIWLRVRTTKQYYTRHGEWTKDRTLAFDFADVQTAVLYGRPMGIADLEVVMENNGHDLTLPVLPPIRPPPSSLSE